MFITFWSVIIVITLFLSLLPYYLYGKTGQRFFIALIYTTLGIVLPLFIFLISAFLVPEWKGGCKYGWVDCFYLGKLALSPIVLWACAGFYVSKILRPNKTSEKGWVVLGVFNGALVSIVSFLYGCFMIEDFFSFLTLWLLIPLYVSIWYSIVFLNLKKTSNFRVKEYIISIIPSIPLWVIGVIWSKKEYLSLPDIPPSCFVVTSASMGHDVIVGPFIKIERYGNERIVNKQLLIFWKFEQIWQDRFPFTHSIFRRIYNKIGPLIARRIKSQLSADIIYFLIKPFELIASLIISISQNDQVK